MTTADFPFDAIRPWCAICLQHRVEFPGDYACPVCEPKKPRPLLPLPAPVTPWLHEFQAAWAGVA